MLEMKIERGCCVTETDMKNIIQKLGTADELETYDRDDWEMSILKLEYSQVCYS